MARTGITVTFAPSDTEQMVMVPLVDDSVLEGEENFVGSLSLAPGGGRVMLGVVTATAIIEDDDSA